MAKFSQYAIKLWDLEGGFVNNPLDKGGATNRGITIATFIDFYGKGTVDELRELTFTQFSEITKSKYWDRWMADKINNQSIAEFLVDWLYNSGSWGIKIPQRILQVKEDGLVGEKTISAVNNANGALFFCNLIQAREKFFRDIVVNNPSQKIFLKGWINRNNSFTYKTN